MSALAPTIRSSLLRDATRTSELGRWSVRRLLEFHSNDGAAAENARSLLREVQIRLAVQHGRLSSLSEPIEQYAKVAEPEGDRARRNLNNLKHLHENTYSLLHQIVDGDGRALLDNFSKPNRKYVSETFDQIMARHGTAVETLADTVIHTRNMKEMMPRILAGRFGRAELLRSEPIESFLHSRLLIQLVCDHYVSLNKGKETGAVSLGADVVDVVDDAVTEAKHVCDANLGVAPEVHIQPGASMGGDFVPPPLIRSWLHHALVEVVKNAMTSNVQRFLQQSTQPTHSIPQSVYISIDKEAEHLRIRIMDQGIGLKDESKAFGFARSTSQKRWDRLQEQQSYAAVRQPLGSLGVGLPLSRLMLRVFGGDVDLSNHEVKAGIDSGCTATLRIGYDYSYEAKN